MYISKKYIGVDIVLVYMKCFLCFRYPYRYFCPQNLWRELKQTTFDGIQSYSVSLYFQNQKLQFLKLYFTTFTFNLHSNYIFRSLLSDPNLNTLVWNGSWHLNSFMTEVPIIKKAVYRLSMDWFPDDRDLCHEKVKWIPFFKKQKNYLAWKAQKDIWASEFDCHFRYAETGGRNVLSVANMVNDSETRNVQPDLFFNTSFLKAKHLKDF